MYCLLSGVVKPMVGVLGGLLVVIIQPIPTYAHAFEDGAMIYVLVEKLIPEAKQCGSFDYLTIGAMTVSRSLCS